MVEVNNNITMLEEKIILSEKYSEELNKENKQINNIMANCIEKESLVVMTRAQFGQKPGY